jgi:hypothetical protein
MKIKDDNKDDILAQFLNQEMIEKAPEGFTSKVMTQVQIESLTSKTRVRIKNKNFVPLISFSVTIMLILAAFLIPDTKTESIFLPFAEIFKNLKISLPDIDLTAILSFKLPDFMLWVFIGIVTLTLFDSFLSIFFNRNKG